MLQNTEANFQPFTRYNICSIRDKHICLSFSFGDEFVFFKTLLRTDLTANLKCV